MPIFRLIVRLIPALFPLIIHSKLNMYTLEQENGAENMQNCSNKCEKHEIWQRYRGQYPE